MQTDELLGAAISNETPRQDPDREAGQPGEKQASVPQTPRTDGQAPPPSKRKA
jgi:hypothetical protein